MVVRTTRQLATILAIRQDADERNARNGHMLALHELPAVSARNWQAKVHIALRDLVFTSKLERNPVMRQKRLEFLSELFGRQITSVNDLSWPECQSFCAAVSIHITRQDLEEISRGYISG